MEAFLSGFGEFGEVLGLFQGPAVESRFLDGLVGVLLRLREEARQRKDYETSDWIRKELARLGVHAEDTPKGPRWRLA